MNKKGLARKNKIDQDFLTRAVRLKNTTVDHLSNMREHSPMEKGYSNLIEIFNDRRNQIVAEIEMLKSKIELIDQQLAIHRDVSQTSPPP